MGRRPGDSRKRLLEDCDVISASDLYLCHNLASNSRRRCLDRSSAFATGSSAQVADGGSSSCIVRRDLTFTPAAPTTT